jgi:hypothetical protein
LRIQAVTARLELVVARDQQRAGGIERRSHPQEKPPQTLRQCGQSGRANDAQRRIADAYLHGPVLGLRPDIPVQILDAADNAAVVQERVVREEIVPVVENRTLAAEREGRDGIQPR